MAPAISASDDSMSPYFLHHSDSPGLVLVSQLLIGDNFASWSRAMVIALSVKNKFGFVDGSIPNPDESDLQLLASWKRNNNIVIAWILNSVSKEISASIIFAESTQDIWEDLNDRFQQSNGPRIFQLRRELINHRQGQKSVSVYFTKLKTIWEELNSFRPQCVCGSCFVGIKKLESYHQMDYMLVFLMGLNESFSQVRSQILLIDPLPSINKVFSMIVQEERQCQIGSHNTPTLSHDDIAFAVKGDPPKLFHGPRDERFKPSQPRKFSGQPRFTSKSYPKKSRHFCSACNINGYTMYTCYKIHGYPPGFKPKPRYQFPNHNAPVHQISTCSNAPDVAATVTENNGGQFFQNLDKDQYNHLMAMFSSHLSSIIPKPHD